MNQLDLKNRNAVVTGGAAGIGFAIAQRLSQSGARVSLWDRDEKSLAEAAKGLGGAHTARLDVSSEEDVQRALAETVKSLGKVDVLVYVAGGVLGQQPRPLEEVSPEDFAAIVDANLKGCFLFARAVAPAMKKAGTGRIVTISSRAGLATSLAFAWGKHALVNAVKNAVQNERKENACEEVRSSLIQLNRERLEAGLLPVFVLPFLVPPVLVGVQSTSRLLAGRPIGEIAGWVGFLALYDVVFLVVTILIFPAVVDE